MKTKLITDVVSLTTPTLTDTQDLYTLRTHPIVNKYIIRDLPKSIADAEAFIVQRIQHSAGYYFIIKTVANKKFAGTICLWNIDNKNKYAEIGYELLPNFWGSGLMTSALSALVNYAFEELNIETIEAYTHTENIP